MITGGGETSARHYFQQNASDIGTPKCEAQGGLYEQYDTSLVPNRPHHPQFTANAQVDPYNDFEKLPEVEDEMMRSFPPGESQPDDYHTYELSGNRLMADPTFYQGSSRSIGSSQKYQLLNRLAKGNSNDYYNYPQMFDEPSEYQDETSRAYDRDETYLLRLVTELCNISILVYTLNYIHNKF